MPLSVTIKTAGAPVALTVTRGDDEQTEFVPANVEHDVTLSESGTLHLAELAEDATELPA